jgi:hypothetical protein
MCTKVDGANPADIGFSNIDELDERRIAYLAEYCTSEASARLVSIPTKMDFDYRFSAKLALALGYSVFGDDYLNTDYAKILQRAVWFRDGNTPPPPLRGQTPLQSNVDPTFLRVTGRSHLVSITITQTNSAVAAILNIGQEHCWTLLISPEPDKLNTAGMAWVGAGQVILLALSIQAGFSMTWPEFFAHATGIRTDQKLSTLESRLSRGTPRVAT